LPMFFPQKLVTQIMYEVTPIAAPETAVPLPPKPPVVRPRVQPTPPPIEQPPQPVHVAKLIAPRALMAPKPNPLRVPAREAPKGDQTFFAPKLDQPMEQPARPREPVKTGTLPTTGS